MAGIPAKCPKCGRTKAWKEEVNAFKSGVSVGIFGRIRFFAPRGLLARPVKKAAGYYKVAYRCHNCGFRKEYPTEDS
jgi:uncharacterized protein (DUF983 family)